MHVLGRTVARTHPNTPKTKPRQCSQEMEVGRKIGLLGFLWFDCFIIKVITLKTTGSRPIKKVTTIMKGMNKERRPVTTDMESNLKVIFSLFI